MNERTRVSVAGKRFTASCGTCGWSYSSASIRAAHTEAAYHQCAPTLGPRPLPPGVTIAGAGSTAVRSTDPRWSAWSGWYWGSSRRPEVW